MKHFLSTLSLAFIFFFGAKATAQEILHFDESGYKAVVERAKKEHKPIFYMIYASWCPHCNKMKADVFTDPTVKAFLEKNFVCAWQDIEIGEGAELKTKFKVKYFPTFLFLSENETILYSVNGEFKSADLLVEAQNALTTEKQLPFLRNQFYDDPSNAEKCLAYIMTLRKGAERNELSAPANIYLATQNEQQLISGTNWRIIANAVTDVKSKEFQFVLSHQKEFASVSSAARVQRKIVNIVAETVKPFTENLDTIGYKKARLDLKSLNLKTADSLVFKADLIISENTEHWNSYKKATLEGTEKFAWDNVKLIKEIAQNYVLHITDKPSLKLAISWMLHTEELTPSYDGYVILSRLYRKIDDKKSAIVYARKAKEISVTLGWSSKDADELFTELGIEK